MSNETQGAEKSAGTRFSPSSMSRGTRRLIASLVAIAILVMLVQWVSCVATTAARFSSQMVAADLRQGTAEALRAGSNTWTAVGSGDIFRPGDAVRVGSGGNLLLRYTDGSRVTVRDDSEVFLRKPVGGKELELRRGMIQVEAMPQSSRFPMRVLTPRAVAKVGGTQFWVDDDGHRSTLTVVEGTFYFGLLDEREILEVKGGQFAVVAADIPVIAYPLQNLEFVDDAVVFQDDFESGIGKWDAAVRANNALSEPRTDRSVLTTLVSTSAPNTSTVLVLNALTTSNQWTQVHPRLPLPERTISVEYDWLMESATDAFDLKFVAVDFSDTERNSIILNRPQDLRPDFSPPRWNRSRTEIIPFRDAKGDNAVLMTYYVNGQRVARAIDFGRIEHISFPMGMNLRMWVDNVVVRTVHPKR